MKDDVYSDLLSSIKTVQEADNLDSEIDLLTSSLFKSDNESLNKEMKLISETTSEKIMETFSKNKLDSKDKEFVRNFLDTLRQLIAGLKVIKLVLAFYPSNPTLENIHSFIVKNVGAGYILDIEVSQTILGGAIIIFNGKYNDFSLEKNINDIFRIEA